jgi:hypothetical protein
VAAQVVHHHDVAWAQFGDQHLVDTGLEEFANDWPVEHHRGDHAAGAQSGDKGRGLPVPVRDGGAQTLPARGTTVDARQVGGGSVDLLRSSTIDEHQMRRFEVRLGVEPVATPHQDIGAVLLGGVSGFFFHLIRCRLKKRRSVP